MLHRLGLERDQIKAKIPNKADASTVRNSQEAKDLQAELEAFEKLKVQVCDVVSKIFQRLNEDNIIPMMLQVLQKKTTESSVFNENKMKYDNLIKELESLQGSVNDAKTRIQQKNEAFLKVKASAEKPNPENQKVLIYVFIV